MVRLQVVEVENIHHVFKYLGSTAQSNKEYLKEVKKQLKAGWCGWRKVSEVIHDRAAAAVHSKVKRKIYKTVVRPATLYNSEQWN